MLLFDEFFLAKKYNLFKSWNTTEVVRQSNDSCNLIESKS